MGVKKYHAICDYCGKDFLISSSTHKKLEDGRQKRCYCSRECHYLSQHNGEDIKCDNCGKIFYRRKYHIDRQSNLNGNQFCSTECEFEYKKKQASEIRKCKICGKEFECKKTSTQCFCSIECQGKWQSTRVGESNPRYKRIEYHCDYCGKPFKVRRYKLESQNNIFCSIECRQKWSKEYANTPEQIAIHRKCALDNLKNQKYSKINSKPQQVIDEILEKNNINYIKEYAIEYYLPDCNLMIEVQGDYWHCNPIKYNGVYNDYQKNRLIKDKAKHTYVLNHYNINILYLWEYDIIHNTDICEKLILDYINNNGKLDNYHSFNFGKGKDEYIDIGY